MSNEVAVISPEGLELANLYLQYGNIPAACSDLGIDESKAISLLNTREVKRYIDTVYLDLGYRNRSNIGSVMDSMISSKLEEAEETGIYSSKDLADLMLMAHKMRMEEIKAMAQFEAAGKDNIKTQTNVQINEAVPFGQGNYGKLMEKLLNAT